jgi:H+/Cl- antiporter ClcA
MRKEYEMMSIIIVCAILGVIMAGITNILYTNGTFIDEVITNTVTIEDIMFLEIFLFILVGVIIGVMKK